VNYKVNFEKLLTAAEQLRDSDQATSSSSVLQGWVQSN